MTPNPGLTWESAPQAGEESKGALRVRLDPWDADSPVLALEVRMRFAKEQPAPLGPLLLHCGGPGSGASCVAVGGRMPDSLEAYDIWSISQRGMKQNEPALLCEGEGNPSLPAQCPEGGCNVSDFTTCACASLDGTPQIGEVWADLDPRDEKQVTHLFSKMYEWGPRCYASKKFQLSGDTGKSYNFLDYVGTQFLAYDIDAFRKAIGAAKMSFYGMSYGTAVSAVYATIFPDNVFRMVVDGNMSPWPQKEQLAEGIAQSKDKAIAKMLRDCELSPSNCSLSDPQQEYDDILDMARRGLLTAKTKSGSDFALSVGMLTAFLQKLLGVESYWPISTRALAALSPRNKNCTRREHAVANILNSYCVVQTEPTWYKYGTCVGPGQTAAPNQGAGTVLEQMAVMGADLAGFFRVEDALGYYRQGKSKFGDAGLTSWVAHIAGWFFWPATAKPAAPMGNPMLQVVVVGNLFDDSTSYRWTQDMRNAFPSGSLLTWQGVGHCLPWTASTFDPTAIAQCRDHIDNYLKYGTLPPDGFVCAQTKPVPVGL